MWSKNKPLHPKSRKAGLQVEEGERKPFDQGGLQSLVALDSVQWVSVATAGEKIGV